MNECYNSLWTFRVCVFYLVGKFGVLVLNHRFIIANGHTNWTRLETLALGSALSTLQSTMPSISDNSAIDMYEEDHISSLNSNFVNAHATCQGSILLLYSLNDEDFGSRSLAFEAAKSLAELCNQIRRGGGLKAPKGLLLCMVRRITRYLREGPS